MIKKKDGTVYRLNSPNPLVSDQEFWAEKDEFIIHNFDWDKTLTELGDFLPSFPLQKPEPEEPKIIEPEVEPEVIDPESFPLQKPEVIDPEVKEPEEEKPKEQEFTVVLQEGDKLELTDIEEDVPEEMEPKEEDSPEESENEEKEAESNDNKEYHISTYLQEEIDGEKNDDYLGNHVNREQQAPFRG